MIRDARPDDTGEICDIYNHYALNTIITFEEEAVSAEAMRLRIEEITRTYPWLVICTEERIMGYAYAYPWKTRAAYRHTVESGIYLHPNAVGRGTGTQLYAALLERLKVQGIRAVIGGIALPNPASVALHEKLGFEKIGHFKAVGFKFGKWIDVGYWQILLGRADSPSKNNPSA
jgi:phosphinothricin acetyltransferase